MLKRDIFSSIGEIRVQALKATTFVETLEPIKARGTLEKVRRLVQRINEIIIYAVNISLIDAYPASSVSMICKKPKKTKYADPTPITVIAADTFLGHVKSVCFNPLSY